MLCAKYSYKDDIAVKKQEAFEEGQMQNAIETAKNFLRMKVLSPEQIAQGTGLTLQQVQDLKNDLK